MKANLRNRAAWLDMQFFAPPDIIETGGTVTLTDSSGNPGTIFYTTDGSDPQPPDRATIIDTVILDQGAAATALIPSTTNGGATLTLSDLTSPTPPANAASWTAGSTGIGFEYDGLIGLDVAAMKGENASVYARIPFVIADRPALDRWNRLTLRIKAEDGFIAYLNGIRVAELHAPASPSWNSQATQSHPDSAAINFLDFDISQHLSDLRVGDNMLALHVLNSSVGSSDLLALPQLVAAEISVSVAGARAYTGAFQLGASATIRARILSDTGDWSAINEATVITGTPASASNLVVSEIMYHPIDPAVGAEFIELLNISAADVIDLTRVAFTAGIDFTFPTGTALAPGGRVVVHGSEFKSDTRLANGGERLTLSAADGSAIRDFTFDDSSPWPRLPMAAASA